MKRIVPLLSLFVFPDIDFNFQVPFGLGIDKQGMVYVANSQTGRIKRYSQNGRLDLEFGKYGENDGELDGPKDVAVDKKGNIYIADTWNNRVCVFSSNGIFKMNIGGLGEGLGRFRFPSSLAIDGEYLYVVDSGNGVIQKFSLNGGFIMEFGRKEGLKSPSQIAIDGDIYISDSQNNRIMRFTKDGEFIESIRGIENPQGIAISSDKTLYVSDDTGCIMKFTGNEFIPFIKGLSNPQDIAFFENSLWIAETGRNRVLRFSRDGILEAEWKSAGSSLERLNLPYDIALGNSDIYIADTGNNRVLRLSSSFKPKRVWDVPSPIAVFVDKDENIYCISSREGACIKFDKAGNELLKIENLILPKDVVVNENNEILILLSSCVLKFSPSAEPLGTICTGLSDPSCITFDNFGFILISDDNKIKRFSSSGMLIKTIENLSSCSGIVVDKDDNIYVAEREKNNILKLDFYGNVLETIESQRFLYPYGLTIDKDGNLYIADCGNHRIVVLGDKLQKFFSEKKTLPVNLNLPDLVVSEIEIEEPKPGIWTRIKASIKNQGNVKADFISVNFFSTSERIGFGKMIKSLAPSESTTINTIWQAERGTNTIKVIIDQEDKIKEANKENNTKEKEIFVW